MQAAPNKSLSGNNNKHTCHLRTRQTLRSQLTALLRSLRRGGGQASIQPLSSQASDHTHTQNKHSVCNALLKST